MKKHFLILLTALLSTAPLLAQYSPCYEAAFAEGKRLFEAKQYSEAKKYFNEAKDCPDSDTVAADEWIRKCKAKIAEINSNPPVLNKNVRIDKGETYIDVTIGEVSFRMIKVEGGTFRMGSADDESDEQPEHDVTLDSYYIGQTEVTQNLWEVVMGNNPSYFEGNQMPVENVSWNDCQAFITKLNQLTGKRFRLPTEAEWEYAARGGKFHEKTNYSGNEDVDRVAWYWGNSSEKTHPVKMKLPNALGIYDMSGNVMEWCNDWYDENYFVESPPKNPLGPSSGEKRVIRGGSWLSYDGDCRVSSRQRITPGYSGGRYGYGLRIVLSK